MKRSAQLSEMLGRTMVSVTGDCGDEEMIFTTEEGTVFRFFHEQDCCESVGIEDVTGNVGDLVGAPITMADEASSADEPPAPDYGSATWTFYKFATVRGYVDVRWLGTSNGYYSESVSFDAEDPLDPEN